MPRLNAVLRQTPARAPHALVVAGLAIVAVLVLSTFHVGFQASDDINYVLGAEGWLNGFPFVGANHWQLRHTITLPTALFIHLLGLHEWVVSLSSSVYLVAFLLVNGYFGSRWIGLHATALATLMMLVSPGIAVVGTYLSPDVPELFFVSTAFWLLVSARHAPHRLHLWLLCGLVIGLGIINRQTALAFVLFAVAGYLRDPAALRVRYAWLAAAIIAAVALEWLYLTAMTGDLAYRSRIDFNHDVVNRFAEFAKTKAAGRWIDGEGNLSVSVFVDPILTVFVSQKYPLFFWLSVPAAITAWRRRRSHAGADLLLLAGLGIAFFVFVALNPKLLLVPRYFIVVAWAAAMLAGWWLAILWSEQRHAIAVLSIAGVLVAGVLALLVENTDPRVHERALVRWVQQHPGQPIHTDIETKERSHFYFAFAGVPSALVSVAAPRQGDLFFGCTQCVERCARIRRCRSRQDDFAPRAAWIPQQQIQDPMKPLGVLAMRIGLDRVLPPDLTKRIVTPALQSTVYQVHQ